MIYFSAFLKKPLIVISFIFSIVNVAVPCSQMIEICLSSHAYSSLILLGVLMKLLNKEYTLWPTLSVLSCWRQLLKVWCSKLYFLFLFNISELVLLSWYHIVSYSFYVSYESGIIIGNCYFLLITFRISLNFFFYYVICNIELVGYCQIISLLSLFSAMNAFFLGKSY